MKQSMVLKALAMLVLYVVIWGTVGFLGGGWEDARRYGFIAGPMFALFTVIPFILKARRNGVNSEGPAEPRGKRER
ncbi:hypothetical protein MN0502_11040 [Arthrobacter sp. MN05-02]|nr:hypothetical protein MN0502_11040 [Arthrobacter sp. MN05-02]